MAGAPPDNPVLDQPRRLRNIYLLWLGQFVSGTGDSVFSTCIGFLVLHLLARQGGPEVGITRAMDALPFLLFGAYAGVLVDRFSRRGLMLVSDLVRAVVVGLVPLLFFLGQLQWWMLPVAAFASYSFATVFNPARDALIPVLAQGRNLFQVNSFFQTSSQLAMILGAGLVGLLLAPEVIGQTGPTGIAWLLALDAASFVVSFVCVLALRVPSGPAGPPVRRASSLHELGESLLLAGRDARLRGLLFLTAVDNFFIMGPAIVGAMFLIKADLGLDTWAYGVFEAVLGLGWLCGTLLIARYGRRFRTGQLVIAGMFFDGITYLPFLWLESYQAFLVAIFVHGLTIPLITVGRTTLIQRHYPSQRLGRIFALVAITVQGFTALSALATGAALGLGAWLGPKHLFFIGGLCGAVCGLLALGFRRLRQSE